MKGDKKEDAVAWRGKCKHCGASVSIKKDGTMRLHKFVFKNICKSSSTDYWE